MFSCQKLEVAICQPNMHDKKLTTALSSQNDHKYDLKGLFTDFEVRAHRKAYTPVLRNNFQF